MTIAKIHNLQCKKKLAPDFLVHRPLKPKPQQTAEEMQQIITANMPQVIHAR